LAFTPFGLVLAACGFGLRSSKKDELLVTEIIRAKVDLMASLTPYPEVAAQQQQHIDVLSSFFPIVPKSSSSPIPTSALPQTLSDMSRIHTSQALNATNPELRRIVLLVAASEAVHAQVIK
jgi:hypothetical protein